MSKQIKQPIGPFRPHATSYENGRERQIEITLYPEYIEVRTVGVHDSKFHVTYGAILRYGAEQSVKHRLTRSQL